MHSVSKPKIHFVFTTNKYNPIFVQAFRQTGTSELFSLWYLLNMCEEEMNLFRVISNPISEIIKTVQMNYLLRLFVVDL